MMKEPVQSAAGGSALANPAVIVVVVLMLGATVYLWRGGYMHPRTGFVLTIVFAIALIALGIYIYLNPA